MGLDKFEKMIKNNQEYFEKEPSSEHMDKFFFKLQEKQDKNQLFKTSNNSNKSWWIGIAATISLLVSIGWFISQQKLDIKNAQQMGLSSELMNIKNYYKHESEKKLNEINQCANQSETTQKLIKTTENQLMKLDYNSDKIENKLKDLQGNEKLELAYIQSLKTKNDLINQMHDEICKQDNNNLMTQ